MHKRITRLALGFLLIFVGATVAWNGARAEAHESGIVVDCDSVDVWEIRRLDQVTIVWEDGASATFEVGNAFTYPLVSEHGFVTRVVVGGQYPVTYEVTVPTDCSYETTTTVQTTTTADATTTTVPDATTTTPEQTTTVPESTTTVSEQTTTVPSTTAPSASTVPSTTVPPVTTTAPVATTVTPPPYVPEYVPGIDEGTLEDTSLTPVPEDLAQTGVNSYLLVVAAAVLIAGGVALIVWSKR